MHPFIAGQLVADHQARAHEAALRSRLVRSARDSQLAVVAPRAGRRLRLGAAALGISVALVAFESATSTSHAEPAKPRLRTEPITLVGLTPHGVERIDYPPGASRAWPTDGPIVGVAVLSGHLTVYGPEGERRVYGAGEGYVAGWTAYRTGNETDEPVETLVTSHVRP